MKRQKKNNKSIEFTIILAGLFLVVLWIIYEREIVPVKLSCNEGSVDLKSFSDGENVTGEWEIYWGKLLTTEDFENEEITPSYISIPSQITDNSNMGWSANGYATLRLQIHITDLDQEYGLKVPYFSSANAVYVNGRKLAVSGKVATSKENYTAQYKPEEIFFQSETENVEIIIQIANFHNRRILLGNVYFGETEKILKLTYHNLIKEGLSIGGLLLISLYYWIFYLIQNKGRASQYLSLLSFVAAVRESIIGERILIRLIPSFPAEYMMKLGYLPVFLLLPLFLMYLKETFQTNKLDQFVLVSKILGGVCTGIVFLSTVKVYDWLFHYVTILILMIALFVICVFVSNRLIQKIRGSYTMAIGALFVVICACSDYFRELGKIQAPELLSAGILIFCIIQACFLSWQMNESMEQSNRLSIENQNMVKQIKKLNRHLEEKVLSRTKELELANSKLKRISMTDPLTGVLNRRHFEEQLKQEWDKAVQKQLPLSIILIDVDYFKQYNDCYGHVEGDYALRKIAYALTISVRLGVDLIARYGGEEFVALLPGAQHTEVVEIGEEMRNNVLNLKIMHEDSLIEEFVTISVGGVTCYPTNENDAETFVNEADQALYKAKEKGRNCCEI